VHAHARKRTRDNIIIPLLTTTLATTTGKYSGRVRELVLPPTGINVNGGGGRVGI